jgi:hypothetical protein
MILKTSLDIFDESVPEITDFINDFLKTIINHLLKVMGWNLAPFKAIYH